MILVARGEDQFASRLREAGFGVESMTLIETVPVQDQSELRAELSRLDTYDGLFFTSVAAVEIALEIGEPELRTFNGHVYVVGERSRDLLELADIGVRGVPADSADSLIESFPASEFEGKRFLYFRGDRTTGKIQHALKNKAFLKELIVYLTVDAAPSNVAAVATREMVASGEVQWVCFFSPSGVEAFKRIVGQTVNGQLKAATIGSTTAERARQLGFNVGFVSPLSTSAAFAQGFISLLNGN